MSAGGMFVCNFRALQRRYEEYVSRIAEIQTFSGQVTTVSEENATDLSVSSESKAEKVFVNYANESRLDFETSVPVVWQY